MRYFFIVVFDCNYLPPILLENGSLQGCQGVDISSKFSRTQSDQAFVGCAGQMCHVHGGPTSQPTGLKGSAANALVAVNHSTPTESWRSPCLDVLALFC